MSQIDPWALPQGVGAAGDAGIPASMAIPRLEPIPKALPIATMIAAGLYAAVCVVAVFVLDSRANLATTLSRQDPSTFTQDTVDQGNNADSHVKTVILIAAALFILTIILWIVMQRRIKVALAPAVGSYAVVFKRAGGPAARIASLISLILVFLSQTTSNDTASTSLSQLASHDHLNMLYVGVRVVLGALIAVYAYRLMRITSEGIDRINAAH